MKDEHITTGDPVVGHEISGLKLMVHHAHIGHAWDLMDKAEEEYLKSIPCPICKAHALKIVTTNRRHRCKLAALASMLLNGHPVEVSRIYRCSKCGYDFRDLSS